MAGTLPPPELCAPGMAQTQPGVSPAVLPPCSQVPQPLHLCTFFVLSHTLDTLKVSENKRITRKTLLRSAKKASSESTMV